MSTVITSIYDMSHPERRETGFEGAVRAARRGRLVLMPIDAGYAIATDAFSAHGVAAMLSAKQRDRGAPIPVMVGRHDALDGILVVEQAARDLARAFWPGPLTILGTAQPSLTWDLGAVDPSAPVAVRMPLHPVALTVLRQVGPMAVMAVTNEQGAPVRDAQECLHLVGAHSSVILDSGTLPEREGSTVVDVTGRTPITLRDGAISRERLRAVCPELDESHP